MLYPPRKPQEQTHPPLKPGMPRNTEEPALLRACPCCAKHLLRRASVTLSLYPVKRSASQGRANMASAICGNQPSTSSPANGKPCDMEPCRQKRLNMRRRCQPQTVVSHNGGTSPYKLARDRFRSSGCAHRRGTERSTKAKTRQERIALPNMSHVQHTGMECLHRRGTIACHVLDRRTVSGTTCVAPPQTQFDSQGRLARAP